jgi:outer membrane protein
MRSRTLLNVTLFLTLAVIALPAAAQHHNDLGLWVAASTTSETVDGDASLAFEDGRGFGLSLNHFWTSHLSTELGATALSYDGTIEIGNVEALDLESLDVIAVTGVAQWHFGGAGARIRPYVGGGVAYVMADDLESNDLDLADIGTVEIDSAVGWVANAGATFALTPRIGIGVDAKYISYRPDSAPAGGEAVELELDPIVVSAGIRFRF